MIVSRSQNLVQMTSLTGSNSDFDRLCKPLAKKHGAAATITIDEVIFGLLLLRRLQAFARVIHIKSENHFGLSITRIGPIF
jgi:hypothetical protein